MRLCKPDGLWFLRRALQACRAPARGTCSCAALMMIFADLSMPRALPHAALFSMPCKDKRKRWCGDVCIVVLSVCFLRAVFLREQKAKAPLWLFVFFQLTLATRMLTSSGISPWACMTASENNAWAIRLGLFMSIVRIFSNSQSSSPSMSSKKPSLII